MADGTGEGGMNAVAKWLVQNGKEATAFGIVLAITLWMFSDLRQQASDGRAQQAADNAANRVQQAESFKELRDREARAWEVRSKDRLEVWKHAEEVNARLDRQAKATEELIVIMQKKIGILEDLIRVLKEKS